MKAAGKIDTNRIVTTEWDLSDHQGGAGMGQAMTRSVFCHRSNSKNTPKMTFELMTAVADNPVRRHFEQRAGANTDGALRSDFAYYGSFGVRPAFRLESGIEIVLEEDEVNLSDSALLEGFTTRQLVEELFRRADRNESLLDQEDEDNEDDDF